MTYELLTTFNIPDTRMLAMAKPPKWEGSKADREADKKGMAKMKAKEKKKPKKK